MEAEKLHIAIEASGQKGVSRKLRQVGRDAIQTGRATDSMGDQLRQAGRAALGMAGKMGIASRSANSLEQELEESGNAATRAAAQYQSLSYVLNKSKYQYLTLTSAAQTARIMQMGFASSVLPVLIANAGAAVSALTGITMAFGGIIASGAYAYGAQLASVHRKQALEAEKQIKALEALRDENGELTKSQQKRLEAAKQQLSIHQAQSSAMGALKNELTETRDAVRRNALALGKNFIPVIKDTINALPAFVDSLFNALGPLTQFEPALRRMGRWAQWAFPTLIRGLVNAGEKGLPTFMRLIDYIQNRAVPGFRWLQTVVARTWPTIEDLMQSVWRMIPAWTEAGVTVTNLILPIFSDLADLARRAFNAFNDLPAPVRRVTAAFTLLAPQIFTGIVAFQKMRKYMSVLRIVASRLGGAILGLTSPFGVALAALLAYRSNLAGFKDFLISVFGALTSEWQKTAAVARTQLGPMVSFLRSAFISLAATIDTSGKQISSTLSSDVVGEIKRSGAQIRAALVQIGTWWRQHEAEIKATLTTLGRVTGQTVRTMYSVWRQYLLPMVEIAQTVQNQINATLIRGLRWLYQNGFVPILNSIQQLWSVHGDELTREVRETWAVIKPIVEMALKGLQMSFEFYQRTVGGIWDKWGDEIVMVTRFVFDTVGSVIGAALDGLITLIKFSLNIIQGDFDEALNNVISLWKRIFGGIFNYVKRWTSGIVNFLVKGFKNAIIRIFNQLGQALIWGSIVPNMLSAIHARFAQFASNTIGRMFAFARGLEGRFRSLGDNLVNNMRRALNAIERIAGGIKSAARGALNTAISKINSAKRRIDNFSPSVSVPSGMRNIPHLDTGGYIQSDGLAMLHAGEQVVKAADVDRGGGGGGTTINIGQVKANSYEEGRAAGRGIADELRSRNFNA